MANVALVLGCWCPRSQMKRMGTKICICEKGMLPDGAAQLVKSAWVFVEWSGSTGRTVHSVGRGRVLVQALTARNASQDFFVAVQTLYSCQDQYNMDEPWATALAWLPPAIQFTGDARSEELCCPVCSSYWQTNGWRWIKIRVCSMWSTCLTSEKDRELDRTHIKIRVLVHTLQTARKTDGSNTLPPCSENTNMPNPSPRQSNGQSWTLKGWQDEKALLEVLLTAIEHTAS